MAFEGIGEGRKRILGIMIVAAALTGCGGSSDSGSASSSTNGSSVISADNAPGTFELSSSTYQVNASSAAILTVNRSGSSVGAASVSYSTIDETAVAGTDYTASRGQLSWNDGDNSAKTVIVPVSATGAGKQFMFALTGIVGSASFGNPDAATVVVSTSGTGSGTSGPNTATVSWSAPTENTNGTALTNLIGYNIYYGSSAGALTNKININTVGIQTYVIDNLSSGNWYFALTSINSAGVESALTDTVEATL
jgi:hypothetical protein